MINMTSSQDYLFFANLTVKNSLANQGMYFVQFSDTDFQKNDEGGRVFNFCIYMHIGPIFRFHFIDCYHSELPELIIWF
jgi:hypothetical protein